MLRIAICDDEPEQIEILRGYLVRISFRLNMEMRIAHFSSALSLLESFGNEEGYEIVFLDIRLPDINGIEAAKRIRERDRKVLVVFVSGRTDYILKGYEARAFRYIVKPVTEQMMADVVIKALQEIQLDEMGGISFREKGEHVKVSLDDIIYFEAQNHKINLICANASHNFYGRIGELERKLSDKGFVRCQKGYLVNANRIRRIRRAEVLMDNGRTLPMSANYLRQTKDTFISALR
jgi:DNA-binding LytR/AlgR family response regulator